MIKEQRAVTLKITHKSQGCIHLVDSSKVRDQYQQNLAFQIVQEENISHEPIQVTKNIQRTYKKSALWTTAQDERLIQLHNQKGNRWVQIGYQLKRSDNQVKNYYHSKLRKTFRKINRYITSDPKARQRPLKMNILSKIIQTAEFNYHNKAKQSQYGRGLSAFNLKNKIIQLSELQEQICEKYIEKIQNLIQEIQGFNKQNKKQVKSIKVNNTNKYKAKQIKRLIIQNQKISTQNKFGKAQDQCSAHPKEIMMEKHKTFVEWNEHEPSIPSHNTQPQNTGQSYTEAPNMQSYFFYNPLIGSYQSMPLNLCSQQTPQIYSQKSSAFTFVNSSLIYKNVNPNPMNFTYVNGNMMRFYMPHQFSQHI